jgi:TolB-like protein/tetratricopeptide (TPR) repeat protein
MTVDVVGYSRLMGQDEAGTIRAVREHREAALPLVREREGRIVKTMGDGMLLEFPSVVAAVECAVAIQHLMSERNAAAAETKSIVYRIGLHVGDVLVDGDDILGEGVNIAARLESVAPPGGVCVSRSVYEQCRGKVDVEFVDCGEMELKNIAEPVHVYSTAGLASSARAANPATAIVKHAPRLSIVVLPFANLSGDKEQDYFVDGVTESLTTDLSRIPGAFVIAPNTAFTFKGRAVDVSEVGRTLRVRYVLEGSVQSSAKRMRVNAQLIDAETGAHIWADRFDKPREDLLEMQDEITARLARALGVELIAEEGRRAEREAPHRQDADDLAMRGWAIYNQPMTLNRTQWAGVLFEDALRLDQSNLRALTGFVHTELYRVFFHEAEDPSVHIRAAEEAVRKALRAYPNSAAAHHASAWVLLALRAPERALRECEIAISLDRNLVAAHASIGYLKAQIGRAEETEGHIAEAIRLSPLDPGLGLWTGWLGVGDALLGRLEQAEDRLRESVAMRPQVGWLWLHLASALARLGRVPEAAEARETGLRLLPHFTISKYRSEAPSYNLVFVAQVEQICAGLRLAGVPE